MSNLFKNIKYVADNVDVYNGHSSSFSIDEQLVLSIRINGMIDNFIGDENVSKMYGSESEKTKKIKKLNKINFTDKIKSDSNKITVFEMELHPVSDTNKIKGLQNFINSSKIIYNLLLKKKAILLIYFGWEADDWTLPDLNSSSFLSLLRNFLKDNKIPIESVIFLNSNLRGDEFISKRFKNYTDLPIIWHDTWMEFETFARPKFSKELDYSFEEHFNLLKKNVKYNFLRVNRTPHPSRDLILYFSEKLGITNSVNWEHRKFNKNFEEILNIIFNQKQNLFNFYSDEQKHFVKLLDNPKETIKKIFEKLPLISSEEEKKDDSLKFDVLSNETIPSSIYTSAPLSYISTSFPERDSQVFLHMSTFNPIFNYHPILYNGNQFTLREFKKLGFKTFDFLFNEKYDIINNSNIRLMHSFNEFYRVNKLPLNTILDIVYDNQEILIHNRNLLLQIKSKERFFEKLVNHIKTFYLK